MTNGITKLTRVEALALVDQRKGSRRSSAREVECPTCGAKPLAPCKGKRGQVRTSNHRERKPDR